MAQVPLVWRMPCHVLFTALKLTAESKPACNQQAACAPVQHVPCCTWDRADG